MQGESEGSRPPDCKIPWSRTLVLQPSKPDDSEQANPFHNFREYDAHLIATHIENIEDQPSSVMGQGMQKYLTLSLGKILTLKDSLQFVSAFLEKICKNLRASGMDKVVFPHVTTDHLDLVLRKKVYPYEYMSS